MRTGVLWLVERGPWPPIFSKSLDFWKFQCFVRKFLAFAVGKDIGFEFYRKVLELAPYSTGAPEASPIIYGGLVPVVYGEMESRRMPHFFHLFLFNLIFTHDSNLSAE